MLSSTLFQKSQLNWKPCKQILLFQSIILFTAQLCIFLTSFSQLIKCMMALSAITYAWFTLRKYWHRPRISFFMQHKQLYAQLNNGKVCQLKHYQWVDWGFMYVLKTEYSGKKQQWFWLRLQLSGVDKRNLGLMIRMFLKKECHSIPSIIINPVL